MREKNSVVQAPPRTKSSGGRDDRTGRKEMCPWCGREAEVRGTHPKTLSCPEHGTRPWEEGP